LISNFGEKESCFDLMIQLKTCRLTTIENYYHNINVLRNRLHNRELTHKEKAFSTKEINEIALKTFRENLPEPSKTMIFARNPKTLEEAFQIILEARHQNYTYAGPGKRSNSAPQYRTNFSDNFRPNPHTQRQGPNNNNSYGTNRNTAENPRSNANQQYPPSQQRSNGNSQNTSNGSNNRSQNHRFSSSSNNASFNRNNRNEGQQNYSNSGRTRQSSGNRRQNDARESGSRENDVMEIGCSNANFYSEGESDFHI